MRRNRWCELTVAIVLLAALPAAATADPGAQPSEEQRATEDALWNGGLRATYFHDQQILESDEVIGLETPERAENAALVPIGIHAQFAQSDARSIRTIWLIVDKNPGPLVGTFHFTPRNGRA